MKNNKFIKFIKKHKSTIEGVAFWTGGLFIGYGIGKYIYTHDGCFKVTDKELINTLCDVTDYGKSDVDYFTGWKDTPVKLDNLGELGEIIKSTDVDGKFNDGFTHFISLRKSK